MHPRRGTSSLGLIGATIAVGLAVRFAPLGLPPVVVKYGASALWAAMIYWLAAVDGALRRRASVNLGSRNAAHQRRL